MTYQGWSNHATYLANSLINKRDPEIYFLIKDAEIYEQENRLRYIAGSVITNADMSIAEQQKIHWRQILQFGKNTKEENKIFTGDTQNEYATMYE
jgi:hypothetical protein